MSKIQFTLAMVILLFFHNLTIVFDAIYYVIYCQAQHQIHFKISQMEQVSSKLVFYKYKPTQPNYETDKPDETDCTFILILTTTN